MIYEPVSDTDTTGYVRLARSIQARDFGNNDGRRTPVYPLFLLLGGLNSRVIWALQGALGILTSWMLFVVVRQRTHSTAWAFLAGLLPSLALNQVFFEAYLLTETLATFLVVLSVLLFAALTRGRGSQAFLSCCLGTVVALTALTRPLFLFLAPLYLLCLPRWWDRRVPWPIRRRQAVSYLAPLLVLIVAWSAFNKWTVGYFGITTLTGYNLTQHSGAFIELAPERYARIRDVYLAFRQQRIAQTGSQSMTIWQAQTPLQEATGLSFAALSQELTRMSLELFARHPLLYCASVGRAAARFWTVTNYWQLDKIRNRSLVAALRVAWYAEQAMLRAANAVFLLVSLQCLARLFSTRGTGAASSVDVAVAAIVLLGCALQALVEYGENARYAIPFQPLIFYTVVVWLWTRTAAPLAAAEDFDRPI